jgi:hypothetical protein
MVEGSPLVGLRQRRIARRSWSLEVQDRAIESAFSNQIGLAQ